ncbi:hypothetical protein Tco_1174126 [Tanacetum coccineum]
MKNRVSRITAEKGRVFLGDWLVVFPEYLDDDIPPFVRRLFLDKSKKQEKKKDGLGKAAKGKAAQLSDKGDKDNVMNGDLGELVHDKATKGKAAQPSDKGDKDSTTIRDLGELVQKDEEWKKLSVDDSVRVCLLYMCELIFRGQEDKKVIPNFMLRLGYWNRSLTVIAGGLKIRRSFNRLMKRWGRTGIENHGRGATDGAKVSGEAMKYVDMSAVAEVEETKSARQIVLKNKVRFLEAKVDKLYLDHDAKEDPLDAAIDVEHTNAVGNPDENE